MSGFRFYPTVNTFVLRGCMLTCLLAGVALTSSAQASQARAGNDEGDRIPRRIILQLEEARVNPGLLAGGARITPLSKRLGIYQLDFATNEEWAATYDKLALDPRIAALQYDHTIDFRNVPNDEFYDRQPNLARMGFPDVWADNTTGGMTTGGEQIVVAVLDAGFDETHPDLLPSLWVNPGEIAGDGVDNDNNGFIDDVHGWAFSRDRPDQPNSQHGTQVLGIMGARGDNGIGVTGTSWNNRVMLFSILEVSDIIAAYEYIVVQRQRWKDSGGERGALVVATNASFGLEGRRCTEFPVWGAMYDALGEAGILTAASTANRSWDVDEWGDMPTTCPSEYLIGVANLGEDDRLWRGSAWGEEHVDLGAAGQGTYTTAASGFYGNFGSTSAAAPYVTGAIALLYSLPCPRIETLLRQDPRSAARIVKQALLRSVRKVSGLERLLGTGGMLDVAAARDYLLETCAATSADRLTISRLYPNPARGSFQLEFGDPAQGPYELLLVDAAGRIVVRDELPAESALPFSNTVLTDRLPRGVYTVRLSNRLETVVRRVILQ